MQRRIDGPGSVSFTFADEDPTPVEPPKPRTVSHDGPQAYDSDLVRYAQNATAPARTASDATTTRPPPNDQVMYLGTNTQKTADGKTTQSDLEFRNLQYASGGKAIQIKPSTQAMTDIDAWAKSLGLPPDKTAAIASVIKNADPAGRDELAQIAAVWAKGELGGSVPSRMVLSGHYADRIADADGSNAVLAKDIQALAKAMPRASAQVEDIMVSACYGGAQTQIDAWRGAFPNVKSVWTYGDGGHTARDKSPTDSVAVEHVVEWEKETRGRALPNAKPQTEMDGMGKATLHNVTLWNGAYHVRS